MMELKNCEAKNTDDILLSILIDSCTITYENDNYRDKESAKEENHFEIGV